MKINVNTPEKDLGTEEYKPNTTDPSIGLKYYEREHMELYEITNSRDKAPYYTNKTPGFFSKNPVSQYSPLRGQDLSKKTQTISSISYVYLTVKLINRLF